MSDIPFIAYESSQTRMERMNRRLWILCLFLIVALVGTNVGWFVYESQWNYVDTADTHVHQDVQQDTDGGGDNLFVGGDSYGESTY